MRIFTTNTQSWLSRASTSHSTPAATLGVVVWLLLALLPAREANGQGTIIFNNRISDPGGVNQTAHVWGSPVYMSLVGLGSNDSPSGTTDFAGAGMSLIGANGSGGRFGYATTFAQLIGAVGSNQPESALVPLAGVTTFRSGTSLGCVASINSTFVNNPASMDAPWATIRMVAWDNSTGLYPTWTEARLGWMAGVVAAGQSAVFNVANIGGTANLPPFFTSAGEIISGLSFNLIPVPEPSIFALAGLGAAVLRIVRRRR